MSRRAVALALVLLPGAGVLASSTGLGAGPSTLLGAGQDEDPRNTALLRRSPEVDLLTLRAPALAAEGRWVEALAIYEKALDGPPDAVVGIGPGRAQGVRDFALARLAEWPEAGRAVCRRRFDPVAEQAFAAARRNLDAAALERVAADYPFSSYAADAFALAGTLRLDAGDAERAVEALDRALAAGAADRAVITARLGLALSRIGARERIEALAAAAEGEVVEGGREVGLAARLKELAAATRERRPAAALEIPGWEMMGGAPAGWRAAERGVRLPRSHWTEEIGLPRFEAEDNAGPQGRLFGMGPTAEFRPLFPAAADGILYVQNGASVSAYNLFGRGPERLWEYRAPAPGGEVMFDNRIVHAVSVSEGVVYANLVASSGAAEDQLGYVRVKFPFPRRALFALDAATGRLLWRLGGVQRSEILAENASFSSAPTPAGGRLYVGAVKQKFSTDPFEHHVLCLDPATGRILWSTFVASGGTEINLFGNSIRESLGSPVSVSGDAVVYSTHHGVIVALDRDGGRIRWTYQYRQLPVRPTRSVVVQRNPLEWTSAPPALARGVAVVAPTDSRWIVGLDLASGAPLWERERGADVRSILGVRGGAVVLGGRRLEILDLKTGESIAPPLPDSFQGAGRGVVAEDGILVPCRDRLRKVGWDGRVVEDDDRPWPPAVSEGGNLLAVDGAVVLAAQDRIHVFNDPRDQERSIREALEAAPDDPALLYRAAIRYLQSGRGEEAAFLLGRAAERAPAESSLRRLARRRLFAVSLEAGKAELEARRPAEAAQRLERALKAAPDPASEVEARVQLAQARLALRDDAAAVAEFQKLLEERGGESYGGTRVFDVARKAIALVLSVSGRAPYAAQEEAARVLLARARAERSAEAYRKVFLSYPNSLSAEEGLFEAAQAEGRLPERAVAESAAWRRFLAEFPESPRVPEAVVGLASSLERMGHLASAAAALRRLARDFPDARVPDGEGKVRAADFAARRLASGALAAATAPPAPAKLSPPLSRSFEHVERDSREGFPLRPAGAVPGAVGSFLFMQYAAPGGANLKAFDLDRKAAAWSLRLPGPLQYAGFLEDGLLVAFDGGAMRLDPRTGALLWRFEGPPRMRGHALAGSTLGFLASDPRDSSVTLLSGIDGLSGQPIWTRTFEGSSPTRLFPSRDAFVFSTVAPSRLHVFEADTGQRVGAREAPAAGVTRQLAHVGADVALVISEGRFAEAFDLPSGALRWRASLAGMQLRAAEAGPQGLVLLGMKRGAGGEETPFLGLIDLKGGKLLRLREGFEAGDPRNLLLDGDVAFVVSREEDASFAVRAVALPDLAVRWTAPAGGGREATIMPPALVREHVVVTFFEQGPDGKYGGGAAVLDKAGNVVQNIRGDRVHERPPVGVVVRDGVVFSVDNRVDVYR